MQLTSLGFRINQSTKSSTRSSCESYTCV